MHGLEDRSLEKGISENTLLDFALAFDLTIANTFKKREN